MTAYWILLGVIACERLAELVVSARHATALLRRGGTEYGLGHFPVMIVLHTALIAGCVARAAARAPHVHPGAWAGRCWR